MVIVSNCILKVRWIDDLQVICTGFCSSDNWSLLTNCFLWITAIISLTNVHLPNAGSCSMWEHLIQVRRVQGSCGWHCWSCTGKLLKHALIDTRAFPSPWLCCQVILSGCPFCAAEQIKELVLGLDNDFAQKHCSHFALVVESFLKWGWFFWGCMMGWWVSYFYAVRKENHVVVCCWWFFTSSTLWWYICYFLCWLIVMKQRSFMSLCALWVADTLWGVAVHCCS